jgi:hypothetical protein
MRALFIRLFESLISYSVFNLSSHFSYLVSGFIVYLSSQLSSFITRLISRLAPRHARTHKTTHYRRIMLSRLISHIMSLVSSLSLVSSFISRLISRHSSLVSSLSRLTSRHTWYAHAQDRARTISRTRSTSTSCCSSNGGGSNSSVARRGGGDAPSQPAEISHEWAHNLSSCWPASERERARHHESKAHNRNNIPGITRRQ